MRSPTTIKQLKFSLTTLTFGITGALLWVELQQYEDAIISFDKALELKPDDPGIWDHDALKELRQYEAALASFDKAVQIQPEKPGSAGVWR